MTVGFVVVSHHKPAQLARLLDRIERDLPDAAIVVHHDAGAAPLPDDLTERLGDRLVPRPVRVQWAAWSQVEATLAGVEHLLAQHPEVEWVVHLSGEDYPVRPLSEMAADLAGGGFDAYVDHRLALEIPEWNGDGFDRYYFHWKVLPRWLDPDRGPRWLRWVALRVSWHQPIFRLRLGFGRAPNMVGLRVPRPPVGESWPVWGGSSWWTINRRAAAKVLAAARDPRLVKHFRGTFCSDEAFVHTVLANDSTLRLASGNQRYVRFDKDQASPRTITAEDLASVAASGAYFARKFDLDADPALFDRLDSPLIP